MKGTVEIGSGAEIYIPGVVKTGSGIQKSTDTQTAWRLHNPTLGEYSKKT
jgi:hypothetical protein